MSLPARPSGIRGRLLLALVLVLVVASFWSLDLQLAVFLEADSQQKMGEFIAGFFPPVIEPAFLKRLGWATFETLAMSALGTLIAAIIALGLAIPAASGRHQSGLRQVVRGTTRLLLNALRSIPELVWASLLVIAAGLGPFPGTLALAAHTSGVLGRLFADSLENLPPEPAQALRANGVSNLSIFAYATVPLALPQMISYALYRWENNIRAATVLGVVGAGGLGQMLYYHLSLFHMREAASVVISMLLLVGAVDAISYLSRRALTR